MADFKNIDFTKPNLTLDLTKTMQLVNPIQDHMAQIQREQEQTIRSIQKAREEKEAELQQLEALYRQILEEKDCISIKNLAVNGSDLIALGMKPGKEIGATLQKLFDLVLEEPSLNTKEFLLSQISLSE